MTASGARIGEAATATSLRSRTTSPAPPGLEDVDKAITYASPRGRAGDEDAGARGGRRAVHACAGGAGPLPARCAPAALRAAAAARRGARAVRRARARAGWRSPRPPSWPSRSATSVSLARAAIGASRRYIQQPGIVETELIELLERALAADRGERTVIRVRLLARLCGALYYSPERGRMQALGDEATALAQELDDPEARAHACAASRRMLWSPAKLQARLEAATEMLTCCAQGRRSGARAAGPCLAGGRPPRVGRPRRGRRADASRSWPVPSACASRCSRGTRRSGSRCARCSPAISSTPRISPPTRWRSARGRSRLATTTRFRSSRSGARTAGWPSSMPASAGSATATPHGRCGARRSRCCEWESGHAEEAQRHLDVLVGRRVCGCPARRGLADDDGARRRCLCRARGRADRGHHPRAAAPVRAGQRRDRAGRRLPGVGRPRSWAGSPRRSVTSARRPSCSSRAWCRTPRCGAPVCASRAPSSSTRALLGPGRTRLRSSSPPPSAAAARLGVEQARA